MKKIILSVFSIFIFVFGFSSCGKNTNENEARKPIVYASFYPIYDLVSQVAGDSVEVKAFMPVNVDPHLWEPTAKDMKELSKADVLFVNGANMEQWVDKVKENLPDLKVVLLSDKVDLISYKGASDLGDFQYMAKLGAKSKEKYKFDFGHTHEKNMRVCFLRNDDNKSLDELIKEAKECMKDEGEYVGQKETIEVEEKKVYSMEMAHMHGEVFFEFDKDDDWYIISDRISENILSYEIMKSDGDQLQIEELITNSTSSADKITYDPHSWLSVNNAKSYLLEIQRVLSDMYPDYKKEYNKATFKSLDKLTKIHAQYKEKFKKLKKNNKNFVVTHYAWEYLAQEYGLTQYPLQGLVSTDSPSLKTMKKAISFSKEQNIDTFFYETNLEPLEANILSQEVNGKMESLTSMEYVSQVQLMKTGSYINIMEENLEKLYKSMGGGEE